MSIFWQNLNNLAKKCSTTPAGPVHSSPATQLDDRIIIVRNIIPEIPSNVLTFVRLFT